jgi:hypothetical protein
MSKFKDAVKAREAAEQHRAAVNKRQVHELDTDRSRLERASADAAVARAQLVEHDAGIELDRELTAKALKANDNDAVTSDIATVERDVKAILQAGNTALHEANKAMEAFIVECADLADTLNQCAHLRGVAAESTALAWKRIEHGAACRLRMADRRRAAGLPPPKHYPGRNVYHGHPMDWIRDITAALENDSNRDGLVHKVSLAANDERRIAAGIGRAIEERAAAAQAAKARAAARDQEFAQQQSERRAEHAKIAETAAEAAAEIQRLAKLAGVTL